MQIISVLSATLSVITTLYFLSKKVVKYLKENPESKLKLLWQSLLGSVATHILVAILCFLYYVIILQNSPNITEHIENATFIVFSIVGIGIVPLFMVKDWYKNRNAFIISEDIKQFEKDNKYFNQYAKANNEKIAYDYIKFSVVNIVKLNSIDNLKNSKHRLSKITNRYKILCIVTWLVSPLIALMLFLVMYQTHGDKINLLIATGIIVSIFIFVNCVVIYYDYKLQDGIVDQTDIMLKSHNKKYRKIIKKNKKKK